MKMLSVLLFIVLGFFSSEAQAGLKGVVGSGSCTGTTSYGNNNNGNGDGYVVNGYIPERIVWDDLTLSTSDRQAVENSSATYWGAP